MNLETFFEKFDQFTDAPDAVARMRELVLNLAVQGRLVEQDSADEDVQLLLARNDETRRVTAKSDRRADDENQPLLSGDDRWDIPESWSCVSIVPKPAESCRTEIHAFSVPMGTFSSGISDSFSSFFKLGPRAFQARLAYSRFASTTNKPIPDR